MATNVLIVEDEPEIREMLNFSLTRAGFTVIEAATGEMALHRPRQRQGNVQRPGSGWLRDFVRRRQALLLQRERQSGAG